MNRTLILLSLLFFAFCLRPVSAYNDKTDADTLRCLSIDSSECVYTIAPRGIKPELDKSLPPMRALNSLVEGPKTLDNSEWNLPSIFGNHYGATYIPHFDLPVEYNEIVADSVDYFSRRAKSSFGLFLRRSGKFVPMMREIFGEEGAPRDLVYLSLIESGYSPTALSSAKACGLWQFMAPTGRVYGLHQTAWVDERMDIEKSTRAAARHLLDLHEILDDWTLALAAYNAGIGKVSRAIKNSGKDDFWKIIKEGKHLKLETVNYVPKFYAALLISKSPERFGFKDIKRDAALNYDNVLAPPLTSIKKVAEVSGASLEDIIELNPELLLEHTPPDSSGYYVKVPKAKSEGLEDKLAALSPFDRHDFRNHYVTSGETLSSIARHYRISATDLQDANGMAEPLALRTGMTLIIPPSGTSRKYGKKVKYASKLKKKRGGKTRAIYTVKKKDTLWGISKRANIKISDLKKWNGLKEDTPIYPGDEIVLYLKNPSDVKKIGAKRSRSKDTKMRGKKTKYHLVQSGDTLWSIARKYGISVNDLRKLNKISKKNDILIPDQKLRVK